MATIDPKKDIKPIIKTDWTAKQDRSPFYQQAEGDLPARYSVSIQTSYDTTGGSEVELDRIKQSTIPSGFESILSFHEKVDTNPSKQDNSFPEEWYISERPGSRIKVLVSIPSSVIDSLNDIPEPTSLPTPWKEIYVNTFDYETKINGLVELLNQCQKQISNFQGKVQGIDLNYEKKNLENSITDLAGLLQSNAINYDPTRSDLIILGINDNYEFLYGQINDGSGFKNLFKGFNTFKNLPSSKDDRTTNFLLNLDEIYEIYQKNEEIHFQSFFESYVLNTPRYEFSVLPKNSLEQEANQSPQKVIEEDNQKPLKSDEEFEQTSAVLNSPEQRNKAQKVLKTTANFVGDTAVAGVQDVSDWITSGTNYLTRNPGAYLTDGMYKRLLNKIPLQDLVRGALECLGFPGFEFIDLAQAYLRTAQIFLNNTAQLINRTIPKINIPDNFPVADYMADLGKKILWSVLESVQAALIQMIVELLQSFLNACKECALINEENGQGRFDGLNFFSGDFLATSFASSLATGIESGVRNATGADFLASQALAEARQSAINPVLIKNAANQSELAKQFGGTTPEEYAKRLEDARVEFRDYIASAGQILTPAEAGNLLLGCQVGQEPKDALTNLLNNFPNIKWALTGGKDVVPSQVVAIWEDLGKIIGDQQILKSVKDATDMIPIEFQCLCDADDTRLREQLLKNKGLSDKQIKEQIDKSVERRNQRLEDLANALEKGNVLDGMIPPVYCTVVFKDSEGNEIPLQEVVEVPTNTGPEYRSKKTGQTLTKKVQSGLIEKDHPSVLFLIDQVLDTVYDSLEMAFNQDISGMVSLTSKDTVNTRQIPRTINAEGTLEINPEWLKLVKDPQQNYSWGPLPADASQPGTTIIDPAQRDLQVDNAVAEDTDLPDQMRAAYIEGQRQSGQTQPTADQVASWETANIAYGGRKRPIDYDDSDPVQARQKRYSEIYGYSPIPITIQEKGQKEFAPGLKNSYTRMCSEPRLFNIDDAFNAGVGYHTYNYLIENNIFEFSGVSDTIKNILRSPNNSPPKTIPSNGVEADVTSNALGLITEAFRLLEGSSYNINYIIPHSSSLGENGYPKEEYGFTISLTPPVAGSISVPSFIAYRDSISKELSDEKKPPTLILTNFPYDSSLQEIPQEQYFVGLLEKSLQLGAQVYPQFDPPKSADDASLVVSQVPNYRRGALDNALPSQKSTNIGGVGGIASIANSLNQSYKERAFNLELYDKAWRDFYCSFTRAISDSPYLDTSNISSLNFTPPVTEGQDPSCDPSLLDIFNLKQRIKDEYGLIQCIETAFPNIDGLGSNKDNAFSKANLAGAVLATVRTYVIEVLIRTLFIFYYFKYTKPESVDEVLINYISNLIKGDVDKKGFLNEFRTETLILYNRIAPDLPKPLPRTENFDVALEYFIRHQVYGVSNRISKTFKISGDTSLTSYLLDDQAGEPAWMPAVNIPAFPNDPNRILNSEIEPPATVPTPVTQEQAEQLSFTGSLSANTITSLNTDRDISVFNLPVGNLFRIYYGEKKSEIWSRESSIRANDNWAPITSNENLSPTKTLNLSPWYNVLFHAFGNPYDPLTQKFENAINEPTADITSDLLEGTQLYSNVIIDPQTEQPYSYGVSYVERLAMSKLMPILFASAAPLDPNFGFSANDPVATQFESKISDYQFSIRHVDRNNPQAPEVVEEYYPGKYLFEVTDTSSRINTLHTFRYDDVWDRAAWGFTGREPPPYIKNSLSANFVTPKEPTYEFVDPRDPRLRDSNFSGGSQLNPTPTTQGIEGYSREFPYDRITVTDPSASPTSDIFLRWITIEGQTVGPYKKFNSGWKLIDPLRVYDNDGRVAGAVIDRSLVNILGTPNRDDFFNNGITVGENRIAASTYGINPSTGNRYVQFLLNRWGNYRDIPSNTTASGRRFLTLFDLDIYSIKQVIEWERDGWGSAVNRGAYDRWINDVQEIIDLLELASQSRRAISINIINQIYERGLGRKQIPKAANPGRDFGNGNFVKEIYLRVIEQDWQGIPYDGTDITLTDYINLYGRAIAYAQYYQDYPGTLPKLDGIITNVYSGELEYQRDIQKAKWANSNFVDKGGRNEFLKGVVNIEAFQNYLNGRFDNQGVPIKDPNAPTFCEPQILSKALIRNLTYFEECGEAQAAELGITVSPDRADFYLSDFFKSVRLGVRISYVEPISQESDGSNTSDQLFEIFNNSFDLSTKQSTYSSGLGQAGCHRLPDKDPTKIYIDRLVTNPGSSAYDDLYSKVGQINEDPTKAALYQKSFYVPNGNSVARVTPIVCSEVEIDPLTPIQDIVNTGNRYTKQGLNGSEPVGFFEHKFRENYNDIKDQLKSTQEFKTLFNYMFPLERMLSLNNIYGSEYLRSYKGIPELFDPTKSNLKDLFFIFYNSGNYPADKCIPTSKDLQINMMNGIPWEGIAATLAIMIAKTALLIFKGFVEAFDINIIVSKAIKDSIRTVNQLIAQGLTLANQTQQLGAALGSLDFAGPGGDGCSPASPKAAATPPPDAWFDPVNENFIPEPQIMFISLALLPITLLPLLWPGLPITPFGIAYWFLDANPYDPVPGPNWLNAMPPSDFLDQLFNRANISPEVQAAAPSDNCNIDNGLPPPGSGGNSGE